MRPPPRNPQARTPAPGGRGGTSTNSLLSLPEPGGFPDISRWLRSNATTPPVWIPNMPHPGGMPARPARMCRTSTHPSFHPPPPGPSANARPPEQTCIPLSLPTSPSSPRLRASARAPVFLPPRPPHPPTKKERDQLSPIPLKVRGGATGQPGPTALLVGYLSNPFRRPCRRRGRHPAGLSACSSQAVR